MLYTYIYINLYIFLASIPEILLCFVYSKLVVTGQCHNVGSVDTGNLRCCHMKGLL